MAAVTAMLEELRDAVPLTARGAAGKFVAQEWTPGGKPRDGVETSWRKDGIRGWTQTFRSGAVRVSFAVWVRDVDESGCFDDLDAVYEQGEQALAAFLPEIEGSPLAGHLAEAELTAADKEEFVAARKWAVDGRVLTAGVVQQDTDLPVMVVVVLEARESSGAVSLVRDHTAGPAGRPAEAGARDADPLRQGRARTCRRAADPA
ncbi:hypothetical protein [Streptomyces sp. NPDC048737]|uniref:hypothetical protein n=1 Tax=unclassified Streptomyces TaxID=2593676 RepID=UPI003434224D